MQDMFDWTGKEELKGKKLCSACAPELFTDGVASGLGTWHGRFDRLYLPKGKFFTNGEGNLEHRETGSICVRKYELEKEE
jgi:hypothetical protein